ncbi:MAG: hypothetical protein KAX49_01350 [Halanaerobiales bacterium]|nr:hypothetical protein [Halanaerobiales bacterium]
MHNPAKYFATSAVNIIKEEGMENRYARHIKVAKAMQSALLALGKGVGTLMKEMLD